MRHYSQACDILFGNKIIKDKGHPATGRGGPRGSG